MSDLVVRKIRSSIAGSLVTPTEHDEHLARLLLLVDAFSEASGKLDGLTKLAKLDFLLRYPAFLEALNESIGLTMPDSIVSRPVEREAVAEPMVRYKYGPWDNRYYSLVGALVGRGLAEYLPGRGVVALRPTVSGGRIASALRSDSSWELLANRISFLVENYDLPGNRLKELIYGAFPALVAQELRTKIDAMPETIDS